MLLQGSGGLLEPSAARRRLSQRWAQALHPLPRPLLATRSALLLVALEGVALLAAVPICPLLRLLLLLPLHLVSVPFPRNHPACLELLRLLSLALCSGQHVAAHRFLLFLLLLCLCSALLPLLPVATCLVLLVVLEQVALRVLVCSELLQLLLVFLGALVAAPVCSALPLLLQVVLVSAVLLLLLLQQPQPSPGYSVALLHVLQPLVHCSVQRLPQLPLHLCLARLLQPQGGAHLAVSVGLVVVSAVLLLLLILLLLLLLLPLTIALLIQYAQN